MHRELSLAHLVAEPSGPSVSAPPLLLMLHGLGSNEEDFFRLSQRLDGRFFRVSARAPYAVGARSFVWFHATFLPEGPVIEAKEAEASRLALPRFIDELVDAYRLDARKVYLMGFSQGAIMAMTIALTMPARIAGVVAMSGRILPEIHPLIAAGQRLESMPFFVAHGTSDAVLPIHHGRATRDFLSALPVDLVYREYGMGHEITEESLADASAWLSQHIGGQEKGLR